MRVSWFSGSVFQILWMAALLLIGQNGHAQSFMPATLEFAAPKEVSPMGTIGITIKVISRDGRGYDDLEYQGSLPSPLVWASAPVSSCGGSVSVDGAELTLDAVKLPGAGVGYPPNPISCSFVGSVIWSAKTCAPERALTYTITTTEFMNGVGPTTEQGEAPQQVLLENMTDTLNCLSLPGGAGTAHAVPTLSFYAVLSLSLAVALAGFWARGRRG